MSSARERGWARVWQGEIVPVLAGLNPTLVFVLTFAGALLVNKRYLSDLFFWTSVPGRWLAAAGWLLATLLGGWACRRWPGRPRSLVITLGGGLLVLAAAMALAYWLEAPLYGPPVAPRALGMLALAWGPCALAGWGLARHRPPRGRVAGAVLAAALVLAVTLLLAFGPESWRAVASDPRYDQTHWNLLAVVWLAFAARTAGVLWQGRGPVNDGLGLGRWRFWLPWTLGFAALMIAIIVGLAARQPDFAEYYPMFRREWYDWDPAVHGWTFFVIFELVQLSYFVAWEYLFRGWMLFRLKPALGANAILVQALPFVLMHIGKPGLELHSSLIAGLALGWLAWRARSFWPCAILHAVAALTMDLATVGWRLAGHAGGV